MLKLLRFEKKIKTPNQGSFKPAAKRFCDLATA